VEDPKPLAGARVVPTDVALHVAPAARVPAGAVGGANDDHVAGHDRRGVQPDLAGCQVDRLVVVTLQVDHSVDAELGHRPAGLRVERDQPVARRHIDDPRFVAARRPAPVGQPAPGESSRCRVATRPFNQAVNPVQLARRGVEGHHRTPRPAGRIQHAVDHERRGLEPKLGHWTKVVGLEPPGDLQVVEVVRGDLVERRVAGVTQVAAVGGPLAAAGA